MLISEVRDALQAVLGKPHMAEKLWSAMHEACKDVRVSPYGYLKNLLRKHGELAAYPNVMLSASELSQYAEQAESTCARFPSQVLDAADRFSQLISVFGLQNIDIVLDRMRGSSEEAAIYMALSAVKEDVESRAILEALGLLEPEARKFFQEYPGAADKLPEQLRKVAVELSHGNFG